MNVRSASLFVCLALGLTTLEAQTGQSPSDDVYGAIRNGDNAALDALLRGGADINARERRGGATPLIHAAALGSADTMKLLIDKGADVNARTNGGATALMRAATDLAKVRLLIEYGAEVNAAAESGRTALMLAAMSDRSSNIVRLLLARGADARAVDKDRMTMAVAAAIGNDVETLRQVVAAGADIEAANAIGSTPLMEAAMRGNTEAVRFLLAKGANVNAVGAEPEIASGKVKNGVISLGRFTPLILASAYGPVEVVKMLVEAGADVNAVEARGMTPLIYAVASDHGDAEIAKLLIARGARLDVRTHAGETALDWAMKSGRTPAVAVLQRAGARTAAAPYVASPYGGPSFGPGALRSTSGSLPTPRTGVERGVAILERMSAAYFPAGGCGACHAQNITDVAVMQARRAGVSIDTAAAAQRAGGAIAAFGSTAPRLFERFDGPVVDIPLYTLLSLAAADHPANRATDALIFNVLAQQQHDGRWHVGGVPRPPMGDGDVSRTALALRAMKRYGYPARNAEMNDRIERGMAWLRSVKPRTAEDHSFRLLGLKWGGTGAGTLQRDARDIVARQRADGGWAQRPEMESDAYATGLTLVALIEGGGLTGTSDAVRRGTQYLLSTQIADGSWHVRSRSPKFQPYFDGGFPHEHDQWISAMATGWATTALAGTLADTTELAKR